MDQFVTVIQLVVMLLMPFLDPAPAKILAGLTPVVDGLILLELLVALSRGAASPAPAGDPPPACGAAWPTPGSPSSSLGSCLDSACHVSWECSRPSWMGSVRSEIM